MIAFLGLINRNYLCLCLYCIYILFDYISTPYMNELLRHFGLVSLDEESPGPIGDLGLFLYGIMWDYLLFLLMIIPALKLRKCPVCLAVGLFVFNIPLSLFVIIGLAYVYHSLVR